MNSREGKGRGRGGKKKKDKKEKKTFFLFLFPSLLFDFFLLQSRSYSASCRTDAFLALLLRSLATSDIFSSTFSITLLLFLFFLWIVFLFFFFSLSFFGLCVIFLL